MRFANTKRTPVGAPKGYHKITKGQVDKIHYELMRYGIKGTDGRAIDKLAQEQKLDKHDAAYIITQFVNGRPKVALEELTNLGVEFTPEDYKKIE